MPAPVTERANRHRLLVILREALQTSDVRIEGEIPITNSQSTRRIDLMDDYVMSVHQGITIDAALSFLA